MGKFSPLQAINAIKGKIPDQIIDIKQSENKNAEDQRTMVFNCLVKLVGTSSVTGYAEESTKKLAQQRACQKFLKALFPAGTTWTEMINVIQNQKETLKEIL
jgi:hypothetical protein